MKTFVSRARLEAAISAIVANSPYVDPERATNAEQRAQAFAQARIDQDIAYTQTAALRVRLARCKEFV